MRRRTSPLKLPRGEHAYAAGTSMGISTPSASPPVTFLPVFLIEVRTVLYSSVSSAVTISADCFSRLTS
jgi:hypothetical protein